MTQNLTTFLLSLTTGLGVLVGGFGTAFLYDHRLRLAKANKEASDIRANRATKDLARTARLMCAVCTDADKCAGECNYNAKEQTYGSNTRDA